MSNLDTGYFSNEKIAEIFGLNTKGRVDKNGYTQNYIYVINRTDGTHEDIDYNTCMCLYHMQGGETDSSIRHRVYNIIDIESPGVITVYHSEGGNTTYKSATIDYTNEEEAKEIFKNKLGGTEAGFDHTKIKKEISSLAYLSYRAFERGEYGNGTVESAIDYLWKSGGRYSIRKLAGASNLLDSKFDVDGEIDDDEKAPEDEIPEGFDLSDATWTNVARYQVKNMLEEPTINKISTNDISVEYDENYAYIGPLMATFAGGTPTITVEGVKANWARQNKDLSFTINSGDLEPSDKYAFYAVVNKDVVDSKENINVTLTLNYTKYKTRLILLGNPKNGSQQLMYHAGKKEAATIPISWNVEITEKVSIQKQDANGQNLNTKGIKFEVYTLDNVKVGELTTDENGRDDINLEPDVTYKIVETKNPEYGYKNANISSAMMKVTKGETTTTENLKVSNGEAQFTITAGGKHEIIIKNTPQLGDLTIKKVDENGNPMAGVEFLIWQSNNWGYININGNAKHTTPSTGTDIKALYEQGKITGGGGTYVEGTTTHYVTNSDGLIVLKNLEIYHSKDKKYNYVIREMNNDEYGYNGMIMTEEDITLEEAETSTIIGSLVEDMYADDGKTDGGKDVVNKKVRFTLGNDTTVTIVNHKQLGNLTIKKVDENGKPMAGVEFLIWQSDNWGYININGESKHTTPSTGTDIKALYEQGKITGRGGTYVEGTTTHYVTNADGLIVLKNLEIYHSKDKKYNYVIRELSNDNYGYKAMIMTEEDITLVEPETSTIKGSFVEDMYKDDEVLDGGKDSLRKKARFTIGNDTMVTIANTPKLGNLVVHKKGDNDKNLKNVEFTLYQAVGETTGYIRLLQNSKYVQTIDKEIDITDYSVEYVEEENIDKATIFKTNKEGKIIINNLEVYSGIDSEYNPVKFKYWLCEETNNEHGYKHMTMTEEDVTVEGGEIIEKDTQEKEVGFTINDNENNEPTEVEIVVNNVLELCELEIIKVDEDDEKIKLEDVEFKIQISSENDNKFLALYNEAGKFEESVKGTVIINKDNLANLDEYDVEYVASKEEATTFSTDENGRIIIKNLEVKSKTASYSYTAYEVYNPNYGYGFGKSSSKSKTVTNLIPNQTTKISIENKKGLGNLSLEKYDQDNPNIELENVGFAIEISPSPKDSHAYLALYNKDGKIVPSVKGTTSINHKNEANDTEYEVRYYYTSKEALKLTENERANITTFETDSDGMLAVNNLEIYVPDTEDKYTYKLIEITNSNYGFIASGQNITVTLEADSTESKELANEQIFAKISGYVWIENSSGKANNYNNLYENGDDKKLTDLYTTDEEGNVIELNQTPEGVKAPVKVKLYNKETEKFIKTQPDKFSEDGKYTFVDIKIEELENYQVVFEYDGFYYTTTIPNIDKDNGSKVQEVVGERTNLNSLFGTVKDGNEVISVTDANGQNITNKVKYTKDEDPSIIGHESTVSKLSFDTTISANTAEVGYNLKKVFDDIKDDSNSVVIGIDNINMGIVLREQPKLKLDSDIYSVSIDVDNKHYNYYYNGRKNHENNINGDLAGVEFEQEQEQEQKNRYTRPVYSSDVQAYNNGLATMEVSLIYKMTITHQSGTLTSVVRELANYFDSDYTVEEIGLSLSNNVIGDKLDESIWNTENITTDVPVENLDTGKKYNSIRIPLSENGEEGLALEKGQSKYIYIKYKVSESAIKGLLSGKSTYHNATEIMSYSTYYGALTGKQTVNEKEQYYVTEQGREGEIYAGIDRRSQPGNIMLKLIVDPRDPEGTKILDTSNYEDDTTSAPSLTLEPEGSRKITGTVFEDTATAESVANNEKLGDGIYSTNENRIAGVKVELYYKNTENIAKLSNKEDAVAITDKNGNYTFGNEDEKVGVLPNDYYIKYTYNNESYRVDTNGNKIKNINVNDYKSTIITSDVIKSAMSTQELIEFEGTKYPADRWYIIKEDNRYSDAADNLNQRKDEANIIVKNSTYNDVLSMDKMEAHTPILDIPIEFTARDEAQVDTTDLTSMRNRIETLENIDFGIIERPDVNFKIEKKVTGLEVTAQTGSKIIPWGDPSNPNESMQYVKTGLDGIVPVEIDQKLLQGATLNLEYSVTVTNECQIDYTGSKYYLYGEPDGNLRTPKVKKVVDYLSTTMTLDSEQDSEGIWSKTTAEYLKNEGLISEEVYNSITENDYHIFITTQFSELAEPESSKTVKMHATRYLATSNKIEEENHVEIIELSGGRTIKESEPGNYKPNESRPDELDDDKIDVSLGSPTGTTVNYTIYIIAAVAMFIILVSGIIIIKKKIIN